MGKGLWVSKDKKYAINTDKIMAIEARKATSRNLDQVLVLLSHGAEIILIENRMKEFLEFMGMEWING